MVAGVVLSTLNKPDVRRRQLAAPVSSWRMGFESIAGCAVLALGARTVTPQVLATIGIDLGIIALFAVAIVSAGLVAARLRVREV